MTLQEEKFVNAYFLHNGNTTRAAEEAGYADANKHGSRIKQQPEVKAEIERRVAEMAMPANEVLARLSDHARASLGDFLTPSGRGVRLDVAKALKSGKAHLLKSYAKTKDGVKIDLVDTQSALTTLARHHKLLTDKVDLTSDGHALTGLFADLSDEELNERAAQLEQRKTAKAVPDVP